MSPTGYRYRPEHAGATVDRAADGRVRSPSTKAPTSACVCSKAQAASGIASDEGVAIGAVGGRVTGPSPVEGRSVEASASQCQN